MEAIAVTTNTPCAGGCGKVLAPPYASHGFKDEKGQVFCATCANGPAIPERVPYLQRPTTENAGDAEVPTIQHYRAIQEGIKDVSKDLGSLEMDVEEIKSAFNALVARVEALETAANAAPAPATSAEPAPASGEISAAPIVAAADGASATAATETKAD
jgi:hypothetical protein